MIVPVTGTLAEELVATEAFIEKLKSERVNDRSHYGRIVARLESLALALLGTGSAGSLLAPKRDGARLDTSPDTRLCGHLSETASYLGDTAARLLRRGALNEFSAVNAEDAMGRLKGLSRLTTTAIRRQAEEDLHAIREGSVSGLLRAADALAQAAQRTTEDAAGKDALPVDPWPTVAGPADVDDSPVSEAAKHAAEFDRLK